MNSWIQMAQVQDLAGKQAIGPVGVNSLLEISIKQR